VSYAKHDEKAARKMLVKLSPRRAQSALLHRYKPYVIVHPKLIVWPTKNVALKQQSQTRGPPRGSNAAREHLKILQFFKFIDNLPIFSTIFSFFSWKFEGNFFHFFQCGPRGLSLSLMQPSSHSEFGTPVLKLTKFESCTLLL